MADNPFRYQANFGGSVKYVPVTPAAADLADGVCIAICAEVAGRVDLVQYDGTARANYPLTAGYNPVAALQIKAPTSGTAATGIWALYGA